MNAESSLSQENSCRILMVRAEHSIKISCPLPLLEAFEHCEKKAHSVSVENPTSTPANPAGIYRVLCFLERGFNFRQCRLVLPWVASMLFQRHFLSCWSQTSSIRNFCPAANYSLQPWHLSLKCHCQCCDTRCWSPKACRVEWEELWSYTRIQDSGVHRKDGSHAVRDSNGSQNRRWEASGNVNLSGLQTEEQPPSSAVSQR